MDKEIDEIRRKLFAGNTADTVFQAVVTEVDETEFTCTVRRNEAVDYYDVRLRGVIDASLQGVALIPKLQSTVLVCRIGASNELFVCQYTEIEKIVLTSGDTEIILDQDTIEITKGEKVTVTADKDKVIVQAGETTLKTAAGGLTLTRAGSGLKKTLNDLLTAIQKLTVTTGVGPSGPPINMADFIKVQTDLSNYLEG